MDSHHHGINGTAGSLHTMIPIQDFRKTHHLPPDFGVATFAPKDYTGLGSIDRAGDVLHDVRTEIVAAVPERKPPQGWMTFSLELQLRFHRLLRKVNPQIGLRPSEIEYAVAGFGDVIQTYTLALMKAQSSGRPLPDFLPVYQHWIDDSLLVARTEDHYSHNGVTWRVRLVKTVYGVCGLRVETTNGATFVRDDALACPAQGFMTRLLMEIAAKLRTAFENSAIHG
ncbi:MAG: hypothetical protein SF029_09970 [bacterium]|nr:hypothetical protein [bacterium]